MKIMQRNSRKLFAVLLLAGLSVQSAVAQKPAYRLFREDGKKVKYEKMLEEAAEADIVLFGEYHTNPDRVPVHVFRLISSIKTSFVYERAFDNDNAVLGQDLWVFLEDLVRRVA